MPVVGKFYENRGFTYRVDHIQDGEVYFVRWKGNDEYGVAMRVDLAVWGREMADGREMPKAGT